ncbi:dihydroorotase [Granulosicoccus sp. 3-233]|uniref:dihydroorotase n=1 Tax=Granulosicoccus sp. 3-233 TaxID=3417969 RepID=UPI003D34E82C
MQITLRQPDDWHLHLRDDAMLEAVVASSARHFGRALVMPNLVPPVTTGEAAREYRNRIEQAVQSALPDSGFKPLMTLYLTDTTEAADVVQAAADGTILAVKLYPAGATTNSASGVTDLSRVMPVLEAMAQHGIVLCVHGEVTHAEVDIFDREARFIETVLEPLRQELPELRVVMEHVTTRDGVEYVAANDRNLAATLTTHHLMINRNHLLVGGIKPHYYCLPIAKREEHRLALVKAATSGDERYFLGTDSAPHTRSSKESDCGCAGVFNAANTMVCLAAVFEEAGALDQLEAFASLNGPRWYGLAPNDASMTLRKSGNASPLPPPVQVGDECVMPFDPARPIYWEVI